MDLTLEMFASQGDFIWLVPLNSILQFSFDEMIKAFFS